MAGLGALLSSFLKGRYINAQNELMNEFLCSSPVFALRLSRGRRHLDRQAFYNRLRDSTLCGDLSSLSEHTVEDLFALYDATMLHIVDSLLPLRHHRVFSRPLQPWLDCQCRAMRRNVRRLERRFRSTRNPADRLIWVNQLRNMQREFRDRESLILAYRL